MNLPANLPEWIYLVGLIVPTLTAWVTVRFARKDSPTIRRIDEQVSNTHSTNLRDDITGILEKLDDVVVEQRAIRAEMSEMRKFDAHVVEWMGRGGRQ